MRFVPKGQSRTTRTLYSIYAVCSISMSIACSSDRMPSRKSVTDAETAANSSEITISQSDSLSAAQAAICVGREYNPTLALKVSSFREDSSGYLIRTSPVAVTGRMVAGGETFVRVYRDGTTKIMRLYQ